MKKELPMRAQRAITVTMPYQRAYAAPLPRHRWQIILPGTGEVLELDEAEVRKSLEQTDGAQLDSLMQQLEEGAADDTGTEADHAV